MKKNIHIIYFLFTAYCCSILPLFSFAGNEKYSTRLAGDSILIDSSIVIADPFSPYNNPPAYTVKQSFGRVFFVYDPFAMDSIPPFHSDSLVAQIRLDIKFEDKTGAQKNLNNQLMKIIIHNDPDSICKDRDVLEIPGAHRMEIKIKWMIVNGDTVPTPADTPNDIALDAEIEVERYYDFDTSYFTAARTNFIDTSSNELQISWGVHNGAEDYELEWTYADDYGTSLTPIPASQLNYDFRTNAIRVRIPGNSYRIPLSFERGYVLYRVRGIGRIGNNFDTLLYGKWSSGNFPGDYAGTVSNFTDKVNIDGTLINTHEPFLNWEHSVIYSEGGRRSDEIRYYDGLGSERQRIRKNNSAQEALVKEFYYDEEKRLAMEAMEAPALDDKLKFYGGFNLNASDNPYSHHDFDTSLSSCNSLPAAMDSASGAAKYYSSLNPNQDGFNAFLPSAFGYTFAQRVYTPDNTGRISAQGGVGATHQIGSGHETMFLYGQPEQPELDRLFGSEVGYAAHYRKQAIRDPNGQISVNYYDSKGNLIASGLAGATPLNVDSLEEPEGTYKNIHSDLMQKDSANKSQSTVVFNGNSLKISKTLIVTSDGNYTFNYSMLGEQFTDSCLPDSFCFDCHYILDISVKDACGTEYVDSALLSRKIGGQIDTACQSNSLSFDSTFSVFLTVGQYTLSKTLSVDDSALQQYALMYYQNNTCRMDSSDFSDSLTSMIDSSGCNIDCASCISPPDSSGFPSYCDDLCGYQSRCDGFYGMMLADVSPRGQYGRIPLPGKTGDDLSVFNPDNFLPKKPFANRFFPDPIYRDPNGDTAYVKVLNGIPDYYTSFTPWETWYIKIVQNDSTNSADTFIVPKIIKNLPDFVAAWKPSWAVSLVKYHPEYCYYEWCRKQDSLFSPCTMTSNEFDSLLMTTTSFNDAKALNLIDTGISTVTPLANDPFFQCGTGATYEFEMLVKINNVNFNYSGFSMKLAAALSALGPAYYSSNIPDSLLSFCTSSDTAVNNMQWQMFRNMYLSVKQGIDQHIADSIALHSPCDNFVNSCGCYGGCIGNDHFSEYQSGMWDPFADDNGLFGINSTFDQPAWQETQPCNWYSSWRYRNRVRRYADPEMVIDFSKVGKEEDNFANLQAWAELQQYYATGQCPIEFDLQNLLAALAQKGDFIGDSVQLYSYPQFTMRLYDSLAHPVDSNFIPVTWSGAVVSDTIFSGYFSTDSGNCSVDLLAPDTMNWQQIRGFQRFYFKKQDSLGYIFSVVALLDTDSNPSTIDDTILLKGRTCIALSPCVFSPVCSITDQANDAAQLWAIMADTGLFASSTVVNLAQAPLNAVVSQKLLSYIGGDSTNIQWQRVSAYKTDSIIVRLFGAGNDSLNFIMNVVNPAGVDFDSVIAFTGLVNDTNAAMFPSNKFIVTAWLSGSPPTPVAVSGTVFVDSFPSFLIMDCELPKPTECNTPENENWQDVKLLFGGLTKDSLFIPHILNGKSYLSQNMHQLLGGGTCKWDTLAQDTARPEIFNAVIVCLSDTDTLNTCNFSFEFSHIDSTDTTKIDYRDFMGPDFTYKPSSVVVDENSLTDGKYYGVWLAFQYDNKFSGVKGKLAAHFTSCIPIQPCPQCEESVTTRDSASQLSDKEKIADPGCTDCGSEAERNLVRNGSFEMGDTLFTSNYAKVVGTCPDTAQYCIPDISNTSDSCVLAFAEDSFICSNNTRFLLAAERMVAETDTSIIWQQKVASEEFLNDTAGTLPDSSGGKLTTRRTTGPLCLRFNIATTRTVSGNRKAAEISAKLGTEEQTFTVDTNVLWQEKMIRFEPEAVMREAVQSDSMNVSIEVLKGDSAGESLPPIGIDSISLGQCPCAPDSFSIPPGIPYPYLDDCGENMELAAVADADYFFDAYSDSIVKNFKNVYTQKCLRALENFTMDFVSKEQHFTLYYYNQAGNLVRTVSPKGVNMVEDTLVLKQVENARSNKQSNSNTQHTLNNFYRYNSLDEQITVNTPDGGYTTVFYDRLGRMVASQNAEQKTTSPQRYSYTKYDALGRTIEAGELYGNTAPTAAILNAANFPDNWSTARTEIIKTFFDTVAIAVPDFKRKNLRTRVSSSAFYDTTGTDYKYATHYDYDIHGNAKTVVQEIVPLQSVGNRYKRMDYKYDLIAGKVLELNYQKGAADFFAHKYFYDADNRLIETHTTTDGVLFDRDAKYFYYTHGPLARMEHGRNRVQGTDYAYTLHGFVKGINSSTLLASRDMGKDGIAGNAYMSTQPDIHRWVARDEFSYMLGYFDGDYSSIKNTVGNWQLAVGSTGNYAPALFNGNIRLSAINIQKFDTLMVYAYRYDQLNRLTQMRAFDNADIANNTWSAANPLEKYATNYTYDPNGNILRMKRNGDTPVEMDSLQYFYYANKNQLAFIKDSVPANFYGDDLDNQNANNYSYDKTGNLIADASEEIQQIKWTVYGKVKKIKRNGGSKKSELNFEYDALNNRVRKIVKDSTNKETEIFYVRDVQGNILATYNYIKGTGKGGNKLYLDEQMIYGSSRIGTIKRGILVSKNSNLIVNPVGNLLPGLGLGLGKPPLTKIKTIRYTGVCGARRYELNSWNGNVQTVITDKKVSIDTNNNGLVDYYTAHVLAAYDYSNGVGAILPDRIFEKESYTFGAQGSEVDREINGTRNNIMTYFRIGDLGKNQWNSVDPILDASWGAYTLLNGNSILFIDPMGDQSKGPIKNLFRGIGNIFSGRPWSAQHKTNLGPKIKSGRVWASIRKGGGLITDAYMEQLAKKANKSSQKPDLLWAKNLYEKIQKDLKHEISVDEENVWQNPEKVYEPKTAEKEHHLDYKFKLYQAEISHDDMLTQQNIIEGRWNNQLLFSHTGPIVKFGTTFKVRHGDDIRLTLLRNQPIYGTMNYPKAEDWSTSSIPSSFSFAGSATQAWEYSIKVLIKQ